MNVKQLEQMRTGKGFIAALDQSGGSTPKALMQYGITQDRYANEEEMFTLVHAMRTRIVTSPAFSSQYILGAILFEQTMDREVEELLTADYLWEKKGVVPFLKIDKGLAPIAEGVQLMKPIPGLDSLLSRAVKRHIFGTKMRSVTHEANPEGIKKIADQQFELANVIAKAGLVPIIEPEVDIFSRDKALSEKLLKEESTKHLAALGKDVKVMLKISIPTADDFCADLMNDPHMVRIVALSGGYSQSEADARLARNHGLIASFSRALADGLSGRQTGEQFNQTLANSIRAIYEASIT